ncbi:Methyltransferase trt5 [Lachnellula suecica]|uniref:Methyltransferase trt5 n=1 Tax=Lachnellula suecica TaxID=602035 RepID=A0A8T9BX76_9HELO|nr:Methyltransferase trt5 [Lachnellula suecica]
MTSTRTFPSIQAPHLHLPQIHLYYSEVNRSSKMAETDVPDARAKIGRREKDVPWYNPDMGDKLGKPARELLENYSGIPASEVEEHVYRIRDEAWDIFPYPCIGGFRFLDLAISKSPDYQDVLQRLKSNNETFLDLGCCFGQELRKVASDGAPQENLYGCDLRPEFFDLGYKLFRDQDTLKSKFIAADIFDPASAVSELDGKIDIIYAGSFLHLFGWQQQVAICKRIVKLLKPKKGSLLLGRQVGNLVAGEKVHRTNESEKMFRHNAESFKKMWDEVGEATGTKWTVQAELLVLQDQAYVKERGGDHGPDMRRIRFSVFRE